MSERNRKKEKLETNIKNKATRKHQQETPHPLLLHAAVEAKEHEMRIQRN